MTRSPAEMSKHITSKRSVKLPLPTSRRYWIFARKFPLACWQAIYPEPPQKYLDLIRIDPQQILPRQQMLDIANQLMSAGQWVDAA